MNVLVTGATGVIGRRLVPLLLARGDAVTAVGRDASRLRALAQLGARTAALDIFDREAARRAMEGHDAVVNLATHVPPGMRGFLPGAWRAMDHVRRDGSAALVDAAIAAGVGRFVQESFAPIYADAGDQWVTETSPVQPARYNRSTLDAERSAERFGRAGGVGVTLRFALLYGPGDAFTMQIVDAIRRGWMPVFGRREGWFAMVSHDDAASAAAAALAVPGGIYNVVDDEPLRRADFARLLATRLGAAPPRFLPAWIARLAPPVGETIARSLRLSNAKLKKASGWRPRYANSVEGIADTVNRER